MTTKTPTSEMHSGTKFFQNHMKISWRVASIFSQTPFRSHLVTSFAPKRNMQMCPPPNVPPCPAMCLPASKWFCLPQTCKVQRKDVDLLLALQLATNKENNHVFITSIISQSDSRFASQPNRSRIAATSQKNLPIPSQIALKAHRCKQILMQSLSQGIH